MRTPRLLLAVATAVAIAAARPASGDTFSIGLFEQYVESLRRAAGIPGLSALLVRGGEVVWERGFGFQDLENRIAARPDTPYPIGGLTQTFAATLLLQCVERGALDLDAPMSAFSTRISTNGARVSHVLSHTSEETPGERFKYDPVRYAALTEVSNACTGLGFRKKLFWEILDQLAMFDSVPGADVVNPAVLPRGTFDAQWIERFERTLARMAVPYKLNRKGEPSRSELAQATIDTSTGVISTVRDLARYDRELSRADSLLLEPETLALSWTNVRASSGAPLPCGLGWFVQNYEGQKIVWSFGLVEDGYSALMIKIPARNVMLVMLANSDGLSAPFQLSAGDLTASPFARVFLKLFP